MTRHEAVSSTLKPYVKIAAYACLSGLNIKALKSTSNQSPLEAAAKLFATAISSISFIETLAPEVKIKRAVFAINPYEPYHILHVTSCAVNAIAFCILNIKGERRGIFLMNILLSRPALHWVNSALGALLKPTETH